MCPEDTSLEGLAGLSVMELTEERARQLGLHKDEKGVVIVRVEPAEQCRGSRLKKRRRDTGDRQEKSRGLGRLQSEVSAIRPGDTVLMFLNRGGKKFYVTVRLKITS